MSLKGKYLNDIRQASEHARATGIKHFGLKANILQQ